MLDELTGEKARKSMTASRSGSPCSVAERVEDTGGSKRRFPFGRAAGIGDGHRGEAARRVDDPCGVVGPLDVAAEPEQRVGGAAQHGRSRVGKSAAPTSTGELGVWCDDASTVHAANHASSTQVSLVPPPWLELTTSEPSFSATRVRPPGTMRILSAPVRTKGRRSTWRGAMPASTKVGQVESASVGWAM